VPRFEPGESVAIREVWRGRIWAARAANVVEDRGDRATFFIPAGTTWMAPVRDGVLLRLPEDGAVLEPRTYDEAHVLSFGWADVAHAALAFFRPDWEPWRWYVNLQDPLRRTDVGFDTADHALDVIVELDGAWRWKDEDEMQEAFTRGLLEADAEPRLRAEGERAVRAIRSRQAPFDRDWWSWRPDPAWPAPSLPEGWDRL
jgi:hypothetical protein